MMLGHGERNVNGMACPPVVATMRVLAVTARSPIGDEFRSNSN